MIENIQHEYFIWEEKNLTDLNQNSLKNEKSVKESSIIETKNDLTQKDWRDITNPKERQKAYSNEYNKYYREVNKQTINDKQKAYYKVNKDKIKLQRKAYREDIKDELNLRSKAYYKVNKDKIKLERKDYFKVNKDKILLKQKAYTNNKRKIDIQYKLSCNLRSRLNSAINNNYKSGSAVKDLGCSIEELKSYLESKFQSGMSWDNWTTDGWHIDHIKPLTSFDLTDRNQLLEACHYTNLQPMWATDNLTKSDKII